MNEYMDRLHNLSEFEVADDSPDVRGWDVATMDERRIGRVDDLIVDTREMRARYLLVDLGAEATGVGGTEQARQVLVPLDRARVDEADRLVRLDAASASVLPPFSGTITPDYEDTYRRAVPSRPETDVTARTRTDRAQATHAERRDVEREGAARITRSAEELKIGRRKVPAGEVKVRKDVETEHVREPVERMREDVRVERRAVPPGTAPADIREDEIRVPITEEEIVVEKRPVAKEEVVIRKEGTTERVDVEEDVRKERVHVDRKDQAADRSKRKP